MQTGSYKKETKKCLQYLMLLLKEHKCRYAADTSNKGNHSLLISSSTTTAKATISPLSTKIPLPTTTATPKSTPKIIAATTATPKKTAPLTRTSTTAKLTTTKVSDILPGQYTFFLNNALITHIFLKFIQNINNCHWHESILLLPRTRRKLNSNKKSNLIFL